MAAATCLDIGGKSRPLGKVERGHSRAAGDGVSPVAMNWRRRCTFALCMAWCRDVSCGSAYYWAGRTVNAARHAGLLMVGPQFSRIFLVRREVMGMGWWQTVSGAVIGDPAADYVDDLIAQGMAYVEPSELPPSVRERLTLIYVEGLGREPTDDELRAVLAFCL